MPESLGERLKARLDADNAAAMENRVEWADVEAQTTVMGLTEGMQIFVNDAVIDLVKRLIPLPSGEVKVQQESFPKRLRHWLGQRAVQAATPGGVKSHGYRGTVDELIAEVSGEPSGTGRAPNGYRFSTLVYRLPPDTTRHLTEYTSQESWQLEFFPNPDQSLRKMKDYPNSFAKTGEIWLDVYRVLWEETTGKHVRQLWYTVAAGDPEKQEGNLPRTAHIRSFADGVEDDPLITAGTDAADHVLGIMQAARQSLDTITKTD